MSKDEMQEQVVDKKKNKIVLFTGILGVLLLVVLGVVITPHIISANKDRKVNEQLEEAQHFLDDLDYEQAIVAYEAVIEIDPMSVEGYLGLASVYEARGEYEKAIRVLEEGYFATNNEALKQRVDEFQLYLVAEEESKSETTCEVENTIVYDIIDANGDGKHDSDVEVLNTIINEQIALGAQVDSNIDSEQYVWVSGRLTEIHWVDKGLIGNISFVGLDKLSVLECCTDAYHFSRYPNEWFSYLNEIDVSQNTELSYFCCQGNNLISLDISNNFKLQFLRCDYNQLTSLDVSNNTEMVNLNCGYNTIMSLDVSNNVKLTDLHCGCNKISELDVSNNVELLSIICYSNELSKLDISNNKKLVTLSFDGNFIENVDRSNDIEPDVYN